MENCLDELHLSGDYVAKALGVTPEIIAAIKNDVEQIVKEQADKLEFVIGKRSFWRDDSDEAEIEKLKRLRSNRNA